MNISVDRIATEPFDEAFCGNRLLATLQPGERALLQPHMEIVSFEAGEQLFTAGSELVRSVFPFGSLMISMIVQLSGGRSVEVASIGKEGAVGGIVSCGKAPAFTHAVVQIAGKGVAIPMETLETIKKSTPHLEHLFCRYSDFLLSQVMQSVACNAFHPIEARAARWLLTALDRVGNEPLELTQEALAGLLGVQRTTVNAVARVLQDQGLIAYRRGALQVRDREGLGKVACECYASVESHFASVLGEDGHRTPNC